MFVTNNQINKNMIIKHLIPITLRDSYNVINKNNEVIGKLYIYKHDYQLLFGNDELN